MKVLCNVGKTLFANKPTAEQARLIQQETKKPQEIDLEKLAVFIGQGGSFRAAAINGKEDAGFISQQLFALDFDATIGLKWALWSTCMAGLYPCFVYRTFSWTKDKDKFRFVYCGNKPVLDRASRDAVQDYLIDFYGGLVDSSCRNPGHLLYGTNKGIVYAVYTNRIDIDYILSKARSRHAERKPTKIKPGSAVCSNIDAIRNRDVDYLREHFGYEKQRIFDNKGDFKKWLICDCSLADFIGTNKKSFCCPFHSDSRPSASIFQAKNGAWLFKCFSGCFKKAINIVGLVQKVAGFDSIGEAFDFLKSVYNVDFVDVRQRDDLDIIIDMLSDGTFQKRCPIAAVNIRRCVDIFLEILKLAREGESSFYMSVDEIRRRTKRGSVDKVSRYLKLLAYHGLLEILPDEEIPKPALKAALAVRGNRKRHTGFYRLPVWNDEQLRLIENRAILWRENGYRLDAISFEVFFRTEGSKVASALYPQTSRYTTKSGEIVQKTTTARSDALHDQVTFTVLQQIEEQGYTTVPMVLAALDRMESGQLLKSLKEICDCYGLQKVRCNKELKERYHIPGKGYPIIITRI